jgi:hypothetical protein
MNFLEISSFFPMAILWFLGASVQENTLFFYEKTISMILHLFGH